MVMAVVAGAQPAMHTRLFMQAASSEDAGQALALWQKLYAEAPAFVLPGEGSAAYHLGAAYDDRGLEDKAIDTWSDGFGMLSASHHSDPLLDDALIRQVFGSKNTARYALAAEAYFDLLEHLAEVPPAYANEISARHLAPVVMVLPDSLKEATGLPEPGAALTTPLSNETGRRLTAWWRSIDPFPETPENERVIEHLTRVAFAANAFRQPDTPLGFDARATIFIRLGAPSHTTPVRINQNESFLATLDVPLSPSFPDGLFWVYDHVDPTAQYLFVRKRGKPFVLGTPEKLLPVALRAKRGSLKAMAYMGGIYRMLALYYPRGHYGSVYEQIADYLGLLDDYALAGTVPSLITTYRVRPPAPAATAFSTLARAWARDRLAVKRREVHVPAAYSNLFDELDIIPVAVRWARFLESSGHTRMEIYWGLRTHDLVPSKERAKQLRKLGYDETNTFTLRFTAVRQDTSYQNLGMEKKKLLIQDSGPAAVIPVQTADFPIGPAFRNLALQWEVRWSAAGAGVQEGPRLKFATVRLREVVPLSNDPNRLVMSDLKPLRQWNKEDPLQKAVAFPQATITKDTRLGLYFELYHLLFGDDDRTHYSVSYEILRRTKDGKVQVKTATSTRYAGEHRTARETIFLDLQQLKDTGSFEVIVHVTDNISGQSVARNLSFGVR